MKKGVLEKMKQYKCSRCGKVYSEEGEYPDLFECCTDCFYKLLEKKKDTNES